MPRFNTLQSWLDWQLHSHEKEIDLGLGRIRQVAANLQLLSPSAKVVTVAGTNGKGSCVATLEALLLAEGRTVGAFTSPHFLRYNERIRLQGKPVSDAEICHSFARIDAARGAISLTYFEFSALAAIDVFTRHDVDVMLLEVGLGGRLDAVNILDADVGIVTSIGLDHTDWLGSTLAEIGREKAGIFREGSWAVTADTTVPDSVAACARAVGAKWVPPQAMSLQEEPGGHWSWRGITPKGEALTLTGLPPISLPRVSVGAALQAYVLLGFDLSKEALADILLSIQLPGRSQKVEHQGIHFILDVAHNPPAAEYQARQLRVSFLSDANAEQAMSTIEPSACSTIHCIVGMMADKDRVQIFASLKDVVGHWHVCTLLGDRAATAAQLASDLEGLGVTAHQYDSVGSALTLLCEELAPGSRVLVMGSFFTVADALQHFGVAH